tara:strand:- start:2070 stop:2363 length:294 start_codon:yes stop_codon:yes gene_type:complete
MVARTRAANPVGARVGTIVLEPVRNRKAATRAHKSGARPTRITAPKSAAHRGENGGGANFPVPGRRLFTSAPRRVNLCGQNASGTVAISPPDANQQA